MTQIEPRGSHHFPFNRVDPGSSVKRAFNRARRFQRVMVTDSPHCGALLIL